MKHFLLFSLLTAALALFADGPGDNLPDKVRPVPPPGIPIPDELAAELREGLRQFQRDLDSLRAEMPSDAPVSALWPDVAIYHKAVHYALEYNEFFRTNEFAVANKLLQQGRARLEALRTEEAPWNTATGLVVRGYVSRIDGSVQPYALVIPASYRPDTAHRYRLDLWFHGRGETLSELSFIDGRQTSPGEFTPPNAMVLHLYGRYCNGHRFAGETDVFEALELVRKLYPIDDRRIVVRGFSLGGAACWHLAVHHADLWAAAAPGAGFSETADFLKVFQGEKLTPAWYEQKLWHLYDATDYAVNLAQCPTIAYSGEIDRQKQAADRMAEALDKEGIHLTHLIGPKTAHKYHPQTREELNRRLDAVVDLGRNPLPPQIHFTTWTLTYNRMAWVTIDGLGTHWERARVEADLYEPNRVRARTTNVTAITFNIGPGLYPFDPVVSPRVVLDGQELNAPAVQSDRSWHASFHRQGQTWVAGSPEVAPTSLRKVHGLQGPIDDAFRDSFLFVRPTGPALNPQVGTWVTNEMERAIREWRRQFRGEPRLKDDVDVSEDDMRRHHLVLWGDPNSNQFLGRIASRLPIRWDQRGVHTGEAIYPPDRYVPLLIYPNPLEPSRYIVFNSGFTFREYDYLNNARQTPKLPDFAVIDLQTPPNSRAPGKVVWAGFFDEEWRLARGRSE